MKRILNVLLGIILNVLIELIFWIGVMNNKMEQLFLFEFIISIHTEVYVCCVYGVSTNKWVSAFDPHGTDHPDTGL